MRVGVIAKFSVVGISSPLGVRFSDGGCRKSLYFVRSNAGPGLDGPIVLHKRKFGKFRGKQVFIDKVHESVKNRAANPLAKNNTRKLEIANQVPAPHAPRFTAQAVEPLATDILGPLRSAGNNS